MFWGGKELSLSLAYFSFKTGVFALKNSYLMQNNLHLKYMLLNVQQSIDTEWHEFILFTSVYYITNTLLVKFQCILTLKSHQTTNRMPNRERTRCINYDWLCNWSRVVTQFLSRKVRLRRIALTANAVLSVTYFVWCCILSNL